jgi:hypothetical protein
MGSVGGANRCSTAGGRRLERVHHQMASPRPALNLRGGIGEMRRTLLASATLVFASGLAQAQSFSSDLPTINGSVTIATGNTFQQILVATTFTVDQARKSLTIQNNNTSDNCWITFGAIGGVAITASNATKTQSILLVPGGSYQRYFPYVPSDAIIGTCASNSDTLYIEVQ